MRENRGSNSLTAREGTPSSTNGRCRTSVRLSPLAHTTVFADRPFSTAGFRDPYVFSSPRLTALLAASDTTNSTSTNSTSTNSSTNSTASTLFATISGGVHDEGAKLFLYRQREAGNVLNWDYISPVLEVGVNSSWSEWSGSESRLSYLQSRRRVLTRRALSFQTTATTCTRSSPLGLVALFPIQRG